MNNNLKNSQSTIQIPISPGELLDKISILDIKQAAITDNEKRHNVMIELDALNDARRQHIPDTKKIQLFYQQLKTVNQTLWDIEDAIRDCERDKDFSDQFIELARSVYITNDQRAQLKKEINQHLGSIIVEEKSYTPY
jgi:hypothetical protein